MEVRVVTKLIKEEVHTVNHRDGRAYTFLVSHMIKVAKERGLPIVDCTFPQSVVDYILQADTIEPDTLRKAKVDDPNPGIVIVWDEGDGHSVVDGNHRLIRRHMAGIDHMPCWVFERGLWEFFCVISEVGGEVDPIALIARSEELTELGY